MQGGLKIRNSRKDFLYEKVFGAATSGQLKPLGRLERVLTSPLAQHPISQGNVPSCFPCAATFINQYNSFFKSDNPVALSWPFLFAQIPHFSGGSIPQDSLNVLRSAGQPKDEKLPQARFWDEPFFVESKTILTPETYVGAEKYKINSYFFFKKPTLSGIFDALQADPLIIGIKVNQLTWAEDIVIPPTDAGTRGFNHAVVLLDVDAGGNMKVCSWDRRDRLDIRTLHGDTEILMACVIRDLPDNMDRSTIRRGFSIVDFIQNLIPSYG